MENAPWKTIHYDYTVPLTKLEEAGYIAIDKEFRGKKPHSTIRLTQQGRAAFKEYKKSLQQVLDDLPD